MDHKWLLVPVVVWVACTYTLMMLKYSGSASRGAGSDVDVGPSSLLLTALVGQGRAVFGFTVGT